MIMATDIFAIRNRKAKCYDGEDENPEKSWKGVTEDATPLSIRHRRHCDLSLKSLEGCLERM